MNLAQLTSQLLVANIIGDAAIEITSIETDSREVRPGSLFFCLPGSREDGHQYASEALRSGAAALVVSRRLPVEGIQVVVSDTRQALAIIADYFYGRPSHTLLPIGITGTNGKTTTSYLIERIMADAGCNVGVIGTIETRYGSRRIPMSGTTPGVLELQRIFRAMVEAGTERVVMEVSSHALAQGRVKGSRFRTAVFTNLTQDHLDFHGSMSAYEQAKGLLFSRLGNTYSDDAKQRVFAVLNADDPVSERLAQLSAAEVVTYGFGRNAHLRASKVAIHAGGTSFILSSLWGIRQVKLALIGKFNVYNALAALGAALCEGIPLDAAIGSLERIEGVPGRIEAVSGDAPFTVLVDYAHTPDGLENVLRALRELAEGRLICVFGCGGDRDRSKRPLMGKIAAELADYAIITNDNPRSEEPLQIMRQIEAGISAADVKGFNYILEQDRRQAIEKAVEMASPGDVVLIAGKGHETYQAIDGKLIAFDDRQTAKDVIRSRI